VTTFTDGKERGVFRDCFLVGPGTTVREVAERVGVKNWSYAETVGNVRLGEGEIVTMENHILSFKANVE
jgi:ribosome-binding ATPase